MSLHLQKCIITLLLVPSEMSCDIDTALLDFLYLLLSIQKICTMTSDHFTVGLGLLIYLVFLSHASFFGTLRGVAIDYIVHTVCVQYVR